MEILGTYRGAQNKCAVAKRGAVLNSVWEENTIETSKLQKGSMEPNSVAFQSNHRYGCTLVPEVFVLPSHQRKLSRDFREEDTKRAARYRRDFI